MEGQGTIMFLLEERGKTVRIDVSDTGKNSKIQIQDGVQSGIYNKKQGWGLGLSLVKRIIETYQGGKNLCQSSELNKGTTFRIELQHT